MLKVDSPALPIAGSWKSIQSLPDGQMVIFLVRKWVSRHESGSSLSFIARDPSDHIKHLNLGHLDLEPEVEVVVGSMRRSRFFDNNSQIDEGFDDEAILAWIEIPAELTGENQAARVAADTIDRAATR